MKVEVEQKNKKRLRDYPTFYVTGIGQILAALDVLKYLKCVSFLYTLKSDIIFAPILHTFLVN